MSVVLALLLEIRLTTQLPFGIYNFGYSQIMWVKLNTNIISSVVFLIDFGF